MNTYIKQFASSVAERFTVEVESQQDVVKLQCLDNTGQLIATRVFSTKQLRNSALVSTVLADLKLFLYTQDGHPPLTPLLDTLYPSAC